MKIINALIITVLTLQLGFAQRIELPTENTSGLSWVGDAREYFSNDWKTQVVTNVSKPSMEVFIPDASIANGSAVIIAPGGGLFALAIEKEGNQVAEWLNSKGITAFVLRYRLLPTGEDGVAEVMREWDSVFEKVGPVLPLAVSDGKNAIAYVRNNADQWDINPEKIGLMGFSAGGALTMGVALNAEDSNRPDFIVPVYPWMPVIGTYDVPEETPPMFLVCASDDELLLAADSIDLYSNWTAKGGTSELHMYARGGHGFGMDQKGLPSDSWIARFYEWAASEGIVNNAGSQ